MFTAFLAFISNADSYLSYGSVYRPNKYSTYVAYAAPETIPSDYEHSFHGYSTSELKVAAPLRPVIRYALKIKHSPFSDLAAAPMTKYGPSKYSNVPTLIAASPVKNLIHPNYRLPYAHYGHTFEGFPIRSGKQ